MVLIERYGNQLLEQMSKQLHLIGTAVTVLKPHYGQMVLNTIMISITVKVLKLHYIHRVWDTIFICHQFEGRNFEFGRLKLNIQIAQDGKNY